MRPSSLTRIEDFLRLALSTVVAGILASIATICFIEVVRRPFGESFVWYDEFVGYLLVWLTLLGAVLARLQREHIGIDNLLNKVPRSVSLWLALTSHLVMIFVHIVLLAYGSQLVFRFVSERAITVDISIGLVYSVIPCSAAVMLLVEFIHLKRLLERAN